MNIVISRSAVRAEKTLPSAFLCKRLEWHKQEFRYVFFQITGFDLAVGKIYVIHKFGPPERTKGLELEHHAMNREGP